MNSSYICQCGCRLIFQVRSNERGCLIALPQHPIHFILEDRLVGDLWRNYIGNVPTWADFKNTIMHQLEQVILNLPRGQVLDLDFNNNRNRNINIIQPILNNNNIDALIHYNINNNNNNNHNLHPEIVPHEEQGLDQPSRVWLHLYNQYIRRGNFNHMPAHQPLEIQYLH